MPRPLVTAVVLLVCLACAPRPADLAAQAERRAAHQPAATCDPRYMPCLWVAATGADGGYFAQEVR